MAKKRQSKSQCHRTRGSNAGYYIFRAWKLDPKTGEKMWAKDHGLKAWKIWVPYDRTGSGQATQ